MKAGELQRPNFCFLVCHVILMVHTDLQDGGQSVVFLRIARIFSHFTQNRMNIYYSKFDKKINPVSFLIRSVTAAPNAKVKPQKQP